MKLQLLLVGALLFANYSYSQNDSQSRVIVEPTVVQDELAEARESLGKTYQLLNADLTPYELTGSDDFIFEQVNISEVLKRRASGEYISWGLPNTNLILKVLPNKELEDNESN